MKIENIDWLRDARIFALESWWPPFWPHLEVDWDRALDTMQRLHLDTLQANALVKWACYPTDLVCRHPELGDRDLIREAREFCDKHGFRMILYSLFGHAMPISTQLTKTVPALFEPLWPTSQKPSAYHRYNVPAEYQDRPSRWHFGGERYIDHCPFAAEQWLLQIVGELADRYEYEAAWLDGSIQAHWVGTGICACPTCRQAHEQEFGGPIPAVDGDPSDPHVIALRAWVARRLDLLLEKVARRFTRNGSIPLVGNMRNPVAARYPRIVRSLNGGLFESASFQVALIKEVSEARHNVETAIFYPDTHDAWGCRVSSGWELENKALSILSCGGTPYLAMPGKYYYDESRDEPAARFFAFMEQQRALLSRQRENTCVAIVADGARRPGIRNDFHRGALYGWLGALLDRHIPLSALPRHLLQEPQAIAPYQALLVPAMADLQAKEVENLLAFAENGGGLYLSGDPIGVDNDDCLLDAAALEMLGLEWMPVSKLPAEQRARRTCFEQDFPMDRTQDIYLAARAAAGSDFPAPGPRLVPTRFGQTFPGDAWSVAADLVPTDKDEPLCPALAFRAHAKGRLVFSPVLWGAQYGQRRDPALGEWMGQLMRWLLGAEPLPVEALRASRMLQLGTTRVPDGWLLYLVNNSNTQGLWSASGTLMQVAEPTLPIGPVELAVRDGQSAVAIYGAEPQSVEATDGVLRIRYDDLAEHAVLHVTCANAG